MFVKAKKILASELMYAKDLDEEEAAEWLDGVLVGSVNGTGNGRKETAKPTKVAAKTAKATKAGKFATVKVRVPTRFSGKFSEKSPTYVWFSDDERRIVVRISTDFSIGRVIADLASYTPGKPVEAAQALQK
jgi:hypothetical protein